MRVLLTVPLSEERFNAIPDIGLGYLATCARDAGHEVRILDCLVDRTDMPGFLEFLTSYKPDVIGMKTYSCDVKCTDEMLREARRVLPGLVTVIGGPHPSYELPEHIFQQIPNAHYAVAGEGEPGFANLLAHIETGDNEFDDVPGLIWRDGSGDVRFNQKEYVSDLDSIPLPAWDLIDPRKYKWGYSYMTRKLPAAPMAMTRGCPFHCTFCGSYLITGRTVRRRSIENILNEIEMLRRDYGVRTIDVVDENFAYDREYLIEFCEQLIRRSIDIMWNCPYGVRLTSLDEELIRLMEKAGCFGVSVGVESGSNRILKQVKKGLTVEVAAEKVRMIKRVSKMMVQGFFIIGFPGETQEEIEMTIELARSLPFDIVVFCPLRVTPGTEMFDTLQTAGVISSNLDYAGLGHHYFVHSYCDIPDEMMRKLYRRAYIRFYFRPTVVFNLIRRMSSMAHFRVIANGLWRLMYSPNKKKGPAG